jgi:outer membrane protein OmpA-like peptidoglycan-associated protein
LVLSDPSQLPPTSLYLEPAPSTVPESRAGDTIAPPLDLSEPSQLPQTNTYPGPGPSTEPDIPPEGATAQGWVAHTDQGIPPKPKVPKAGLVASFLAGIVSGAGLVYLWPIGIGNQDGSSPLSTSTQVAISGLKQEVTPKIPRPVLPRSRENGKPTEGAGPTAPTSSATAAGPTLDPGRPPTGPHRPPVRPGTTGEAASPGTGQTAARAETQARLGPQPTEGPREGVIASPQPTEGADRDPMATGPQAPFAADTAVQANTKRTTMETETGATDKAPLTWTIPFSFNRLKPSPDALRAIMADLSQCAGTIVVTGHTCTVGGTEANRAVGLARADSVGRGLARSGVPAQRLEIRSAGADQPIASNATREGRRANRRVVIDCRQE